MQNMNDYIYKMKNLNQINLKANFNQLSNFQN